MYKTLKGSQGLGSILPQVIQQASTFSEVDMWTKMENRNSRGVASSSSHRAFAAYILLQYLFDILYNIDLGFSLMSLRRYPSGLGKALIEGYLQSCSRPFRRDLRKKYALSSKLTDREIFAKYPLCQDQWFDAEIASVFFYLYGCKSLKIPESWESAIVSFKNELTDLMVSWFSWVVPNFLKNQFGLQFTPCSLLGTRFVFFLDPLQLFTPLGPTAARAPGKGWYTARPRVMGSNAQKWDHETSAKTHETPTNFHKRPQKKKR